MSEPIVIESSPTLPYHANKQRAILGHMLQDKTFFLQARTKIKPEWFNEEAMTSKCYRLLVELYEKHNSHLGVEDLLGSAELMSEPLAEQQKYRTHLYSCIEETNNYSLNVLRTELTTWLQVMTFAQSIHASVKEFNRKKFDEVKKIYVDTARTLRDISFAESDEIPFNDPIEDFKEIEVSRKEALTSGLVALDRALLDGNPGDGGLQQRDTTLIIAPVNIGKTTTMITMAMHNVRKAKSVLFLTHEGAPEDIRRKMWCSFFKMSYKELMELAKTDMGQAFIKSKRIVMDKYFTYVAYNKPGMTVEEVESIIRHKQEERASFNDGKGYDLLVCDYPAKLTTTRAAKGHMPKREIDGVVYDYFVQLALEYGFHSLLAVQTNRDGSRINNGAEDRLLTMEDVAESFSVPQVASNVITLNRGPMARERGRITFYVAKSRSSETGTAVVANSRFDRAVTHDEEYGCTWYRDQRTMEDRIDDLLKQYRGREIPTASLI